MIKGPNKHPNKWTSEESYDHGFLSCVEASEDGPINFQRAMSLLPDSFQEQFMFDNCRESRRHWMRGWNEARNQL